VGDAGTDRRDEVSDYPEPDEPTMPTASGWPGPVPEAFVPLHMEVDKVTGEVLEGTVIAAELSPATVDQLIDVHREHVVEQLSDASTSAVALFREPEAMHKLAAAARVNVLAAVEAVRADWRARRHPGRPTPATLAPELNALSDAHDVLTAIAGVFTDGAKVAKRLVGETAHELADDPRRGTTSVKVADTHGADLAVTRTQQTKVRVDEAELLDCLAASLINEHAERLTRNAELADDSERGVDLQLQSFSRGVRDGIARYRQLASSHTFKTTELDAWSRDLEAAEQHELAIRLGHAYGRVAHGEPTVKIDRVSRKGSAPAAGDTD
jgi:hypothetical protein